jgi:hypothetical protein
MPTRRLTCLKQVAAAQNAHLSRNALSLRAESDREQFVIQRCFGLGRDQAQEHLQLRTVIAVQGYPILDVEAEFVIYDSNLAMDAGWIVPPLCFVQSK